MWKRRIRKIIIWSIVLIVLGLIVYRIFFQEDPVSISIQQEVIIEETLYSEVSATGTINPIELVEVGTQVSGIISEVYVDYNDIVKQGQLLAKMDDRILSSSFLESKSNLIKTEVTLKQAEIELKRVKELFNDGYSALTELETAQNEFDIAKANYGIAQIQHKKNSVNLGYTDIISPINGIVISKNIDVGQTIAASFSTPVLFSIANDLKQMKIEASVDEADIGIVKSGQKVLFTVDAFPKEVFEGVVEQVQLNPTVVQNVVTYNVIVMIQNPEQKLMPGMTATILIQTHEKPNSISVPNSAVAFIPEEEEIKILNKNDYKVEALKNPEVKTVWVLNNKKLIEKEVEIIFTNGIKSAIVTDLKPGDSVVTNIKITNLNQKSGGFFNQSSEEE